MGNFLATTIKIPLHPFTRGRIGIGVLLTPSTREHMGANVFPPAVVRQDE